MFNKTPAPAALRGAQRFAAVFAALALILPASALISFAAVQTPVVTDGAGYEYPNGGSTHIDADTEVFVTPGEGSAYYYSFKALDSVEVYYSGAAGEPSGSYFDGLLENGVLVATLTDYVNSSSGTPVTAADGWKITVPKPAPGAVTELWLVAYNGAARSDLYAHSFTTGDEALLVTDGGARVFASGGVTGTDAETELFLANIIEGQQYYYTFDEAGTVDVYYDGATGSPRGSYFDGPLWSGAFVASLGAENVGWTPVGGDGRITVPAPGVYDTERYNLTIKNASGKVLFTHTFKWFYSFSASFAEGGSASFRNDSAAEFKGYVIIAAYDQAGRLAKIRTEEIAVAPGSAVEARFAMDASPYPAGALSYAAFCWDQGYAPVFPSITTK